ncbi:MarR family winged helix-turn-helix transcriptional regulator [Amycolatopsis sp. NPDC059090]|uniref:MarR family winged helix-turn-helix transcriptional regulator n=1 Tax=unclassified Amycolatopsis TaxID=2618356 RepID=UPI00366F5849
MSRSTPQEPPALVALTGSSRLGALARRLAQAVTAGVLAEVQQRDARIRAVHLRVFASLENGPARAVAVARLLGTTKQTTGPVIDELVAWGYLARRDDPADARAKLVDFTGAGRELAEAAAEAVRVLESRVADEVGREEVDRCRETLWRAVGALEPPGG